ncbi:MAG TPA: acyltransferase family protein, partial [Acidimicrobiia bacterium]|nr:acyltransferase family protein [Acidimicrobiia bacterium]
MDDDVPDAVWIEAVRLPYRPALDGLRALAVLAVLAYHGGVDDLPGGFLGVDVFFVLSGFLITSLLLAEWRTTGRLDLRTFWARRACRLLPALVLVLVAVVLTTLAASAATARAWRGDALATLGYVANWRLVVGDHSYFALLEEPSPLRHAWSLGIEEQWYVLWPIVLTGLLWTARRLRRPGLPLGACAVGAAGSAVLMAALFNPGTDPSRVYYGTDTRAQGLLVGAALAFVLHGRGVDATTPTRRLVSLEVAGLVAVGALAWAATNVGETDASLYRGGFAVWSFAAAVAVAAAVQPGSPVLGRILGTAPLRALGRISYGVYLWHWPLFLWLSADRVGVDGPALFGVRIAATLAVATLSYRLVEDPVRRGWRPEIRVRPLAVSVGATTVALAVVVAASSFPRPDSPGAPALAAAAAPAPERARTTAGSHHVPSVLTPAALPPPPTQPVRVLVAGDSVAFTLADAMPSPVLDSYVTVDYRSTHLGCGVVAGRPLNGGRPVLLEDPACQEWESRWRRGIEEFAPDVAVVLLGAWEVLDHRTPDGDLVVGSARYERYLLDRMERGIRILGENGTRVVLLT